MTTEQQDLIFALDIGTRSVIGVLGRAEGERFHVLAIEKEEHGRRAMQDGQIEDIEQVAKVARMVTDRLETFAGVPLTRVCVAAAGRALRTERAKFELHLPSSQRIDNEWIGQLEAGAVSQAEMLLNTGEEEQRQFFLVGYTVVEYQLDHYPMTTLKGHNGQNIAAEVVATFLPGEVVESLYAAMHGAGLEVVSLTLEPIAALNAAIPAELRLLNLALTDIGAGTSDIAVCREGSVVGYTMATVAGDEITETLMRAFLVDFQTAERMKPAMSGGEAVTFTDILGLQQTVTPQELQQAVEKTAQLLAQEIAHRILAVNGDEVPAALFLAGGGSQLVGLCGVMADCLGIDPRRVAVAGSNFERTAFSDSCDINNPEYATPLGIAVSAGLGLIHDSYIVLLNGQPAKLFRNGTLTVQDILLMNGYTYADMLGRTGQSLVVTLDGTRRVLYGEPATPCDLLLNGATASAGAVVHAGDAITFVPARHGRSGTITLAGLLGEDFCGTALVNGEDCPMDELLKQGDVVTTERLPIPCRESAVPPPKRRPPLHLTLNGEPRELLGKEDGTPHYLMDLLGESGLDFDHLERPVLLQVNGADGVFLQELKNDDVVTIRCQD